MGIRGMEAWGIMLAITMTTPKIPISGLVREIIRKTVPISMKIIWDTDRVITNWLPTKARKMKKTNWYIFG
jgi:hypothetical protein